MNGDGPLVSLDARAYRVSYSPELHALSLNPNQKLSNARCIAEYRQAAAAFAEGLAIGGFRDENTR